jgi:hypothetical protein
MKKCFINYGIAIICCVAVSLFLTASLSYAELIGAWAFDEGKGEVVKDATKNGNDGTATEPQWVKGIRGNALQFDAAKNTVVTIPDSKGLFTLTKFTIACWVKTAKTNSNWMGLVGKWDLANTGVRNFGLWLHNPNCTAGLQCYGTPNIDIWPGAPNLADDKWHHVAGTFDGTKAILYVDGVKTTEAGGAKLSTTADPVRIGRAPWAGHYTTAAIDEVAIYNDAIKDVDIKTLMDKGVKPMAVEFFGKLPITWASIKEE